MRARLKHTHTMLRFHSITFSSLALLFHRNRFLSFFSRYIFPLLLSRQRFQSQDALDVIFSPCHRRVLDQWLSIKTRNNQQVNKTLGSFCPQGVVVATIFCFLRKQSSLSPLLIISPRPPPFSDSGLLRRVMHIKQRLFLFQFQRNFLVTVVFISRDCWFSFDSSGMRSKDG